MKADYCDATYFSISATSNNNAAIFRDSYGSFRGNNFAALVPTVMSWHELYVSHSLKVIQHPFMNIMLLPRTPHIFKVISRSHWYWPYFKLYILVNTADRKSFTGFVLDEVMPRCALPLYCLLKPKQNSQTISYHKWLMNNMDIGLLHLMMLIYVVHHLW